MDAGLRVGGKRLRKKRRNRDGQNKATGTARAEKFWLIIYDQ